MRKVVYILDLEDPRHVDPSLDTWVRWSSDSGGQTPAGTGRDGYYWISSPEVGWCNPSLCGRGAIFRNGVEIFNFKLPYFPPLIIPRNVTLKIHTRGYTKKFYQWYGEIPFNVYVNDQFIGSDTSAKQKEEKVSEFVISSKILKPMEQKNNIFIVYEGGSIPGWGRLTYVTKVELDIPLLP